MPVECPDVVAFAVDRHAVSLQEAGEQFGRCILFLAQRRGTDQALQQRDGVLV